MRSTYSLNKHWEWKHIDEQYKQRKPMKCNVPHTWNINGNKSRGTSIYRRKLEVDDQHQNDILYIEFQGVNNVCKVYLNDLFVGEHRGGYSTFRFDITELYKWNENNILQVIVDNAPTNDVSPLNGDFTIYGGIYRSVNLICVSESHFALDYWGTDGLIIRSDIKNEQIGQVEIELHVVCQSELLVRIEVFDKEKNIIVLKEISSNQKRCSIELLKPRLWRGKQDPYLYTIRASLTLDGEVIDEVSKSFGFRKLCMHSEKGLFLNNEHFRVKGIAKHQDFDGVGNAITPFHIRKDFELIREIGANSIRLAHYQHCQLTYDICDQEGYVVWAEIPVLSLPDQEGVLENAITQLKELILQNCHHPSICFWGIQNEIAMDGESIAMYKSVDILNETVTELLPNAITACANMYHVKNNSPLNFITDIVGYNLYFGWYYGDELDLDQWIETFHLENPQVVIGISEYGADSNLKFHSETPKVKDYSEEFQASYHEKTYEIIEAKPYIWGSFVWNMFDFGSDVRDEGGTKGKNCKGLVSFDRKTKKDAFYYYKAKWSIKPFIYICGKRFVNRSQEKISIKIYSNQKEISLIVNGEDKGTISGETVFIFDNISLRMGQNRIIAHSGKLKDETILIKVSEPDRTYQFVDSNPEINVQNWFTQKTGEVDLFPKDCYSILDSIGDLMEDDDAWSIVKKYAPEIVKRSSPGAKPTLLWAFNKMKDKFSESKVKEINSRLNKIRKNNV